MGWASLRQVWPTGGARSQGATGDFDVSDVDLTNIPALDCAEDFPDWLALFSSCRAWRDFPTLGIAGLESIDYRQDAHYILERDPNFDVSTLRREARFQMTAPIPDDDVELEALKQQVAPDYATHGWEVHIHRVPYDFGQLWRWKVILDRFAFSAANTVGIVGGQVGLNTEAFSGLFGGSLWVNGFEPVWAEDLADLRTILIAWTVDPESTAAALPDLLPQLGIGIDSVGLVGYASARPIVAGPATADSREVATGDTASGGDTMRSDSISSTATGPGGTSKLPESVNYPESSNALASGEPVTSIVKSDAAPMPASKAESSADEVAAVEKTRISSLLLRAYRRG